MNYGVYALAVSGNTLYAGGDFTTAGGVAANYVAQWNGSSWSALSSGMWDNSPYTCVYALAVSGNTLYAGGGFTTAGGVAANYVAQWNGSDWSALGSGMNNGVYALAVSGNTLYAGGPFTTAGGVVATNVAQWNGNSWSALGSGMWNDSLYPYVNALAVLANGTLYAGGYFTTAGGVAATNIAQWNGSSWSALGSGLGGGNNDFPEVSALAVSGNTLYAAGLFTTAGGVAATNVAQWNGSSWSALGSGLGGGDGYIPQVSALAVSGNTLCVGGMFTTAGGLGATNIAQWIGSFSWSPVGVPLISVTVEASPANLSFAVDGTTYSSPQVFTWMAGSDHTISTTSPQSAGTGVQYVWTGWSDGEALSHSVSPTGSTTYTASFAGQYYLTMNGGAGGSAGPPSGWYAAGTNVSISATPASGYVFSGWTGTGNGSYTGTNNPAQVTIDGAITETADFVASQSSNLVASQYSLTMIAGANGTVSPASGTYAAGTNVPISAAPSAGYVFGSWMGTGPGSYTGTNNPAQVTMNGLVTETANFVPGVFVPSQGTYNGLFYDETNLAAQSCGAFTVTTTSSKRFSGSLQIGGARYSFSGQFGSTGSAQCSTRRARSAPLGLALQLDLTPESGRITGTVSNGTSWAAQMTGYEVGQGAVPAGNYTLVIPGGPNPAAGPGGDSFGTVKVGARGAVKLAGSLADGTKISQSATLCGEGWWPLYVPLYGGKGCLVAWLTVTNAAAAAVNGESYWIKPAGGLFYPGGFTNETAVLGSRYVRVAGENELNITRGQIVLTGGGLETAITNGIMQAVNRITDTNGNDLLVSFTPSSGSFSGSLTGSNLPGRLHLSGVVLQDTNLACGYFFSANRTNGTGCVRLTGQ
jgi:hypothetical protein